MYAEGVHVEPCRTRKSGFRHFFDTSRTAALFTKAAVLCYTGMEFRKEVRQTMNIQIFGKSKCFDTKKAQRYFKERRED